jgi:hypothetical protein
MENKFASAFKPLQPQRETQNTAYQYLRKRHAAMDYATVGQMGDDWLRRNRKRPTPGQPKTTQAGRISFAANAQAILNLPVARANNLWTSCCSTI